MKKFYFALISLAVVISSGHLSATDYYFETSGNFNDPAAWNTMPNGTGTSPGSFAGSHTWHFMNRATVTVGSGWTGMPSTAIVIIENGINVTYNSFGTIPGTLEMAAGGTLTLGKQNNLTFGTLDPNSTIIFNSAAALVKSGPFYGNVVIAVNTLLSGGQVDIMGTLTINASRILTLNGQLLALSGANSSIAGLGAIFGDNTSGIGFFGGNGGNNGTLRLAAGGEILNIFYVQYNTGADFIRLGTDLFIENAGALNQQFGSIDINGHKIQVDNTSDISLSNSASAGTWFGSPTSELIIEAATIGTQNSNTLFMDASAPDLGVLVLNSPGATIINSANLIINDSLSILDGTFDTGNLTTVVTPAGGPKARVSRIGGSGLITGDLIAQTVLASGSTGWNLLGAPVDGETVASWDTYATNGGTSGLPMTCTGCFYDPSLMSPPFHSIQGWDEANDTYDTGLTVNTNLTPGTGFWVYAGDGSTNTNDLTLINTGPVLQGVVAVGLSTSGSNTDHWNLVANPFPSSISWENVFAETDNTFPNTVNAEMHIFSADVGYGSYVAGVGGTGSTGGLLDVLAMGQGFYVSCDASAVSLIFDESCKVADPLNTEIWRTSASKNANREYFKLKIDGAYGADQTMINFNNSATPSFDRLYDGHKMFASAGYQGYGNSYSKYTTISTRGADGTDYSINSLPPRTGSVTIPVLARVMVTGSHTISVTDKVNFESCLILHDKLAGKYHDLNSAPYVFDINDTTSTPRFELIMCQNESGPVMSVEELQKKENIFINQDASGAFVRTNFEVRTKATISVFNIVGQQILKDINVDGTDTLTRLDLSNMSNQVVIIRVTTDNETVVKKIVTH